MANKCAKMSWEKLWWRIQRWNRIPHSRELLLWAPWLQATRASRRLQLAKSQVQSKKLRPTVANFISKGCPTEAPKIPIQIASKEEV